jgi:hypothetical protein
LWTFFLRKKPNILLRKDMRLLLHFRWHLRRAWSSRRSRAHRRSNGRRRQKKPLISPGLISDQGVGRCSRCQAPWQPLLAGPNSFARRAARRSRHRFQRSVHAAVTLGTVFLAAGTLSGEPASKGVALRRISSCQVCSKGHLADQLGSVTQIHKIRRGSIHRHVDIRSTDLRSAVPFWMRQGVVGQRPWVVSQFEI